MVNKACEDTYNRGIIHMGFRCESCLKIVYVNIGTWDTETQDYLDANPHAIEKYDRVYVRPFSIIISNDNVTPRMSDNEAKIWLKNYAKLALKALRLK